MGTKKQENTSEETESFKIRKSVLQKVRDHKEKGGPSMQRFIEDAIEEKLVIEAELEKLRNRRKKHG